MLIKPNKNKIKKVIAAVDWGFRNAGVILVAFVDYDDVIYIVHEIYASNKIIDWWLDTAKQLREFFKIEVFICDPAEPAFIEQFNRIGLRAVKADNEVAVGISLVKNRLKGSNGKPSLFFLRNQLAFTDSILKNASKPTGLLDEITGYAWSDSKKKEEPVKENDHSMDCLRYLVLWLDADKKRSIKVAPLPDLLNNWRG